MKNLIAIFGKRLWQAYLLSKTLRPTQAQRSFAEISRGNFATFAQPVLCDERKLLPTSLEAKRVCTEAAIVAQLNYVTCTGSSQSFRNVTHFFLQLCLNRRTSKDRRDTRVHIPNHNSQSRSRFVANLSSAFVRSMHSRVQNSNTHHNMMLILILLNTDDHAHHTAWHPTRS